MYQSQVLSFTDHARDRQQQRGVTDDLIRETIAWGRELREPDGCMVYRAGGRESEEAGLRAIRGLVVVLSPEGAVITVYRSSKWSSWDRKRRRRFRPRRPPRRSRGC